MENQEIKISLAAARINAGFTQDDVAEKMHKNKQTIVNWEKGRTFPDPAEMAYLCTLYNIPMNFIFMPRS